MRVGTWNVENLFLPGGEFGPPTDEAYAAKLAALAFTITSSAPDVLALQEIGETAALNDLVDLVGGDWHVELADGDDRGIRVAYMSRLPMINVEQISDFPAGLRPIQADDSEFELTAMGRPALQVRVEVDGRPVDLVTCHLKSKLVSFPDGRFSPRDEGERARYAVFALNRRAAEAATVRERATQLLDGQGQERAVVVLGDLNDEVNAATTQILLGPPGSEIGTGGFAPPDQGDGQRLWNLAPLLPEDQRFTRIYRGRPELIDHALVSHAVVQIVGEGDVTTVDTGARSITDFPSSRVDDAGSDHRPLFVDIRL